MRNRLAVLAALLLSLVALPAAAGGRPIPLVEVVDAPVMWSTPEAATLAQMQAAVLAGCAAKGWVGQAVEPGHVHAVLTRPDYRAEIDILYSTSKLSIKYAASEGLDYNADRQLIHRNFNRWLTLLQQAINVETLRAKA